MSTRSTESSWTISIRSVVARPAPKRRAASRALSGDAVATTASRKPRARFRIGRWTVFTKLPAPQTPTPTSRAPAGRGSDRAGPVGGGDERVDLLPVNEGRVGVGPAAPDDAPPPLPAAQSHRQVRHLRRVRLGADQDRVGQQAARDARHLLARLARREVIGLEADATAARRALRIEIEPEDARPRGAQHLRGESTDEPQAEGHRALADLDA